MSGELIDREALERIIHRAAELQTGEREIGDGLTENEVLDLGSDVGIPARYLKQALVEERGRDEEAPPPGLSNWLAGPRIVGAERVVARTPERAGEALDHWMTAEEGLSTLRKSARHLRWERQSGFMAEVRISLSAGGRSYVLTKVDGVMADLEPLEDGYCHIRLAADLERRRTRRLAKAGGGIVGAIALGGIWLALGFALPVALAPIVIAAAVGVPALRKHRFDNKRTRLALESVLDRLERDEISASRQTGDRSPTAMIDRVASEIRKALKP